MIPFEISLTVTQEHIDELNHVNNVVYLQWVQDIANLHWSKLKEGHDTSNYVWVVLRHELDYSGQAVLGDVITTKTWVGETAGIKSVRHVEFYKGDTLLVKAKTFWCLVDSKTLRPKRITGDILNVLIPHQE
jgi:acyl-CoA thioester hydrolase